MSKENVKETDNKSKKSGSSIFQYKKIGKLQKAVLIRTIMPMLLLGIVIVFAAVREHNISAMNELKKSMSGVASNIALTYDVMYPGDYVLVGDKSVSIYKGDYELTGDYSLIDNIYNITGYDISIFFGNTRILTTMIGEDGGRIIATGVNNSLLTMLEKDGSAFIQMDVMGEKYHAYYYPLYNTDDSIAGMVGIAKKDTDISRESFQQLLPIYIITVLGTLLAALISLLYTNNLIDDIKDIKTFLHGMTGGELSNEMDRDVIKREDELGEAGKDIVQMQNAIRALVEQDMLTTLYNRRYGGAKFRKIQKKCLETGMPYSVCIGDIDFFKKVNDTYGHEAGDVVLKTVALTMKEHMMGKGIVARWGGEEFLLVFDKLDQDGGEKELWALLEKIRALEMPYDGLIIKVTMTFGIIDGSVSDDYGELLRRADEKLYFGKANGRNRVVTELEGEPEAEAEAPAEVKNEVVAEASAEVKAEAATKSESAEATTNQEDNSNGSKDSGEVNSANAESDVKANEAEIKDGPNGIVNAILENAEKKLKEETE